MVARPEAVHSDLGDQGAEHQVHHSGEGHGKDHGNHVGDHPGGTLVVAHSGPGVHHGLVAETGRSSRYPL